MFEQYQERETDLYQYRLPYGISGISEYDELICKEQLGQEIFKPLSRPSVHQMMSGIAASGLEGNYPFSDGLELGILVSGVLSHHPVH